MYIVKNGPEMGTQVWPAVKVYGNGRYPNLQSAPASCGTFYASTSHSYFWTDSPRPCWGVDDVIEIAGKFAVKAIANNGNDEQCLFTRYFDGLPVSWLKHNMDFRSYYNPENAGCIEDPELRGWLCAWEWENRFGATCQMRLLKDGTKQIKMVAPYAERRKMYAERRAAATQQFLAAFGSK